MKVDFSKLSDEEMVALSEGNLSKLSDKTMRYLDSFNSSVEEEKPSMLEAASAGFIEGVPFMKDVMAGVEAVTEEMADDSKEGISLSSTYDRYKGKMDDINASINRAEELSPEVMGIKASTLGDIAGGVALPFAGVKGAMVAGALSGVSRSEDRDLTDALVGASLGGASYGVVKGMTSGVKKVANYAGEKLSKMADDSFLGILGLDKTSGAARVSKHLDITNQSLDDFTKSLRDIKIDVKGKKVSIIEGGDVPDAILKKLNFALDKEGSAIGNILKEVQDLGNPSINSAELRKKLASELLPLFSGSDDPATREIAKDLGSFISDIGKKIVKETQEHTGEYLPSGERKMKIVQEVLDDPMDLPRLHELQKDIRKRISAIFKRNNADATVSKEQERLVAQKVGEIIDDTVGAVSPEALTSLRAVRKTFGNLSKAEELLSEKIDKSTHDVMGGLKTFVRSTFMPTLVGGAIGGPTGAIGAIALDKLIRNPKLPSYVASGLPKIAQQLSINPSGKIAAKLMAATALSDDKFHKTLRASIADISLKEMPIKRSIQDVKARSNDIFNILDEDMPSVAQDFRNLIEEGSDSEIALFMDGLAKQRKSSSYLESGVGWDGIAYSNEDKQALEIQLKRANIPAAQRQKLLMDLRASGKIPDMNSVQPREKKKYEAKPKLPNY